MALELDTLTLEHRGMQYTLSGGAPEWAITRDGQTFGHLVVKSVAGEEGEPVYTIRRADGGEGNTEGSDWEQIVKAYLNDVDASIAAPTSESPGATQ
jgi:hypothetical protein